MREGGFPAPDEPLDTAGLRAAERVTLGSERFRAAPELASRQTAQAAGGMPVVEESLRDIDHGDWAGRSFADVHAADPAAFAAWLADPAGGAPEGETLDAVIARVRPWLVAQEQAEERSFAIVSPMIVRAILAAALAMPLPVAMRIDLAPLSQTILSFNRQWRLQAIVPA
jgi:broad specificity phosphatase PhoE